jgi:hypothetical protein
MTWLCHCIGDENCVALFLGLALRSSMASKCGHNDCMRSWIGGEGGSAIVLVGDRDPEAAHPLQAVTMPLYHCAVHKPGN